MGERNNRYDECRLGFTMSEQTEQMLFSEIQAARKDIQDLMCIVSGLKVKMGIISAGTSAIVSIIVGVIIAIIVA